MRTTTSILQFEHFKQVITSVLHAYRLTVVERVIAGGSFIVNSYINKVAVIKIKINEKKKSNM